MGLLGVVQSLYFFTRLPEKVAIHFGPGGFPDSWTSNEANLAINISLYVLLVSLFVVISMMLEAAPVRFLNIPGKEYWMAEERRVTTIEHVGGFLNVFGTALIIFFLVLGYLGFSANMRDPVVLDESVVWSVAGVFVVFTVVWLFLFYRKFKMPSQANSPYAKNRSD